MVENDATIPNTEITEGIWLVEAAINYAYSSPLFGYESTAIETDVFQFNLSTDNFTGEDLKLLYVNSLQTWAEMIADAQSQGYNDVHPLVTDVYVTAYDEGNSVELTVDYILARETFSLDEEMTESGIADIILAGNVYVLSDRKSTISEDCDDDPADAAYISSAAIATSRVRLLNVKTNGAVPHYTRRIINGSINDEYLFGNANAVIPEHQYGEPDTEDQTCVAEGEIYAYSSQMVDDANSVAISGIGGTFLPIAIRTSWESTIIPYVRWSYRNIKLGQVPIVQDDQREADLDIF